MVHDDIVARGDKTPPSAHAPGTAAAFCGERLEKRKTGVSCQQKLRCQLQGYSKHNTCLMKHQETSTGSNTDSRRKEMSNDCTKIYISYLSQFLHKVKIGAGIKFQFYTPEQ